MKVNPRLLRLLTVFLFAVAGDCDEERPFFALLLVQVSGHIIAVHPRQADVQEDHVRLMDLGRAEGGWTVRGDVNLMTFFAEQEGQVLGSFLIVLDRQNMKPSHPRWG
jgi:hypothetical protein